MTNLKYVFSKGQWRLVLTFHNGCKIWSEDGKRMLTYLKVPDSNKFYKSDDFEHYFQGITAIKTKNGKEAICVGNSLGEIYFFENTKENYFTSFIGLTIKTETTITCLGSYSPLSILIASDIQGLVYFFSLDGLKENKMIKTLDINNKNNPITTLEVLDKNERVLLILGDVLGKIKLFDLLTYMPLIEINAHYRLVSSMNVNNDLGILVSGSEDTYVHVWQIKAGKNDVNIDQIYSHNNQDRIIIGSALIKKDKLNLLLSHYDVSELTAITNIAQ